MRALHGALFPLDYEDSFYQTAVRGLDNIFTWAAFMRCACAGSRTARYQSLPSQWTPRLRLRPRPRRGIGLITLAY